MYCIFFVLLRYKQKKLANHIKESIKNYVLHMVDLFCPTGSTRTILGNTPPSTVSCLVWKCLWCVQRIPVGALSKLAYKCITC